MTTDQLEKIHRKFVEDVDAFSTGIRQEDEDVQANYYLSHAVQLSLESILSDTDRSALGAAQGAMHALKAAISLLQKSVKR